jgi:hypothetical protein
MIFYAFILDDVYSSILEDNQVLKLFFYPTNTKSGLLMGTQEVSFIVVWDCNCH